MNKLFLILISVFFVFLQLTILTRLVILAVAPNLVLAFVLALAIAKNKRRDDRLLIFIPALLFDALNGLPFGLVTLSLWLTYAFINWVTDCFIKQNNFLSILISSALGAFFYYLVLVVVLKAAQIFNYARGGEHLAQFYYIPNLLMNLVYGALATLAIFYSFKNYLIDQNDGRI